MVDKTERKCPRQYDQRDNAEHEPGVLVLPMSIEFQGQHAVARHQTRKQGERDAYRQRRDHLSMLARVQDHVRGCARLLRCFVEATANLCGENKVIFEMRDVFEKDCFMIESDVIEEHQVLM